MNETLEQKSPPKKPIIILSIVGVAILSISIFLLIFFFSPSTKYKKANDLLLSQKYDEAILVFEEIKDYKDSQSKISLCNYNKALLLFEKEKYNEAKSILLKLGTYKESQKYLKQCNHLILYNYIKKEGTPYRDVISIDNKNTGLSFQIKENDKTIRIWYEYEVDSSSVMSTIFSIPLDSNNIEVAYFLELIRSGVSAEGEGIFYPELYDGNLKNTSNTPPEDKIAIKPNGTDDSIWVEDIEYSKYLELEFYNGGLEFLEEIGALQYYCDFEYLLTTLDEHITDLKCGVTLADFGVKNFSK